MKASQSHSRHNLNYYFIAICMPFHLTKILVVVINFILNARIYNSSNIKFLP